MKPEIIIICGPTGSGKSELALDLAEKINGEIISADSLAVYKKLDIGTAKPSVDDMKRVKHHLINVCDPWDEFSVSDYERLALQAVSDIRSRGKMPVICGGTGFYINSVLYRMSYGNTAKDTITREKYMNMAKTDGVSAVYAVLKEKDPESALKIHENDLKRVVRALEIYFATGKKKSAQSDKEYPRFDYLAVTIGLERQELYAKINARVDKMMKRGLVDEVKSLIDSGITIENQCMQGIGYKEVYNAFEKNDFENLSETIKINSRHYAKRQITFFKRLPALTAVTGNSENKLNDVLKMLG